MKSYIINGGKALNGTVEVSGSKNAALPIIAATILHKGTTKLYNIPNIHDIKITMEILRKIGCKINKKNDKLEVNAGNVSITEIPESLMREMRSSVIIAGAILRKIQKSKVFISRRM